MNSQMAIITSILPIGFGLFSLQFPAGLVLYFLVSNLWRLGQQELIMHKITRPGQAAIAAATSKDDAIDVKGGDSDTSAFPRAAGGLRKLFQLPAAANGDAEADRRGGNGANGAPKPRGRQACRREDAPAKNAPAKRAGERGRAPRSPGLRARGTSSGGARRKNNKKRKRR